jgi:hypothetical protein
MRPYPELLVDPVSCPRLRQRGCAVLQYFRLEHLYGLYVSTSTQKQGITLTFDYSSSHLPLASQRPRFRSDFRSSTYHSDHHVLSWRDHLRGGPLPRLVHFYLRQILGLSM